MKTRERGYLWVFVIAAFFSVSTEVARAEGQTDDAALLSKQGDNAYDQGDYTAALGYYRDALGAERTALRMQNVAACLALLGRYEEALSTYDELLKALDTGLSADAETRASVATNVQRLEKKLGFGRLLVRSEPNALLVIDGISRGSLPWLMPLRLAAERHIVHVEKPGFVSLDREVLLEAGAKVILDLPLVPEVKVLPNEARPVIKPKPPLGLSLGIRGSGIFGSSLGSDLENDVAKTCVSTECPFARGWSAGVRASLQLRYGFAVDLGVGYLGVISHFTREVSGKEDANAIFRTQHVYTFHGVAVEGGASYRWRLSSSWELRSHLGVGLLSGQISDPASGTGKQDTVLRGLFISPKPLALAFLPVVIPDIYVSFRLGPVRLGIGGGMVFSPFDGPMLAARDMPPEGPPCLLSVCEDTQNIPAGRATNGLGLFAPGLSVDVDL